MTDQEILASIKNILLVYLPEKSSELTESTHLVDNLGINSARLVDIVLDLEDKFGISIPDAELDRMATIGDVVRLVSYSIGGLREVAVETAGAD